MLRARARWPDHAPEAHPSAVVRVANRLFRWLQQPAQQRLVRAHGDALESLVTPYGTLCDQWSAGAVGSGPEPTADHVHPVEAAVVDQLTTLLGLLRTEAEALGGAYGDGARQVLDEIAQDLASPTAPTTPAAQRPGPGPGPGPTEEDGSVALADHHAEVKKTETTAANWLRGLAMIVLPVLAAVVVGVPFLMGYPPLSLDAQLTRVTLAVPLGGLVLYAIRESGQHRREANRARDLAAHLRHLVAFIRLLPAEEQHRYRVELGRLAWPPADPPTPADASPGITEELARLTEVLRGRTGGTAG